MHRLQCLRYRLQERERSAMGHQSAARRDHQRRQARRTFGVDGLHALHRSALRGGLTGRMHLPHRRRHRIAQQGPVHRLRLLLLRVSVRRAAISASQQFRFARQDGQMHLLRRRWRPRSAGQRRGIRKIRLEPLRRRQAADVRRDVLDQVFARRRWRCHWRDLQGAGRSARLWLRCLGLADGVSRGRRSMRGYAATESKEPRGKSRLAIFLAYLRLAVGALMFLAIAGAVPAAAQQLAPDGAPNPTASGVNQQTLLRAAPRIEGYIDIPDARARVLVQPAGRTWDHFHEVTLHWFGAIVIIGMIAILGVAYLVVGRLRISAGRSGRKVHRFSAYERFSHWLTAVSFVILGLTGLNITFGKILLLPVIGPDAFSSLSQAAKYVHNFTSFAFVMGLVLIVALWFRHNIPRRVDIDWLRQGGGFIKSKHAPAGRFNAGEKAVFWIAVLAGIAVTASGFLLLFPFYITNILGMQIAQVVHAVVAVLFVAVILAHIYIGTLGMEGAFEAMWTGEVDSNWAKEHHDLWLEDLRAKDLPASARPSPS